MALIADVIEQDPLISVAKVRDYRDADILYLVQRVLSQIDPALRWLVRYGAVLRQLDADVVRDVLHRHVRAALEGTSLDKPAAEPYGSAELWPEGVEVPEAGDLWKTLRVYAGESAWVSRSPDLPGAVQLHDEVLQPMRGMLGRQPVPVQVHHDAIAFSSGAPGRTLCMLDTGRPRPCITASRSKVSPP